MEIHGKFSKYLVETKKKEEKMRTVKIKMLLSIVNIRQHYEVIDVVK